MNIQGGQKFAAALQAMAGAVTSAESVKVGFLSSATYPDGTPVALIAAINNWGAPSRGQPPRSFFGNLIAHHSHEWGPATGELLVANEYDAAKTLAQVGEAVSGQLRQEIVDLTEPPLAPSTIRRKGFSKPLIERGIMLNAVDFEVNTK
ncbi:hypothetical protein [Bradyrhizobium sp.]